MRTVLTKEDLAYEEGYRAFNSGAPSSVNPYPVGSRQYLSWLAGWERGQECGGTCDG